MKKLAFVDWGIGGLGVVRECLRSAPDLSFVYVSDTGVEPYGKQAPRALVARLSAIAMRLADEHAITDLAIACNAASTVAKLVAERAPGVRIHGIIEHGVSTIRSTRLKRVGILGGVRTIRSRAHARSLARDRIEVIARIAQPLSGHIEAGRQNSPIFEADFREIVAPLRSCDAILLACTHYPAATDIFARMLPDVQWLDPATSFARALMQGSLVADRTRTFLTTGDRSTMRASAERAWQVSLSASAW